MASCEELRDCVFRDDQGSILGVGLCVNTTCECSIYIGFAGEDCSEQSPQTITGTVIEILSNIALFVFSCYFIYVGLWTIRLLKRGNKRVTKETLYGNLLVVLLSLISSLTLFVQGVYLILAFHDPSKVRIDENEFQTFLTIKPEAYNYLLAVSPVCINLGILWICFSWLTLLKELAKILPVYHMKTINAAKQVLVFLTILCTIAIIMLMIPSLALFNLATLLLGTVFFLLFILLFIGRRYLIRVLKECNPRGMKKTTDVIFNVSMLFQLAMLSTLLLIAWETLSNVRFKTGFNEELDWNVFFARIISRLISIFGFVPFYRYCKMICKNAEVSERSTKKSSFISTSVRKPLTHTEEEVSRRLASKSK